LNREPATAGRRLSPLEVALMVAGIVIGAGIFRAPADVARLLPGEGAILALWAAGAVIALLGGLTWAALAARWGGIGGEYRFLAEGWGPRIAALFVWARMAVIQTGSLATVAFVAGDYLATLAPASPALLALACLLLVTLANLAGLDLSARLQTALVLVVVVAMLGLGVAGFAVDATPTGTAPVGPANPGLAVVFVMLVYGGWNEAAYLSGETRGGAAGLRRGLLGGLLLVAALYLLLNAAYLASLGPAGLAGTPAPAAAIAEAAGGPGAAAGIAIVVVFAALSTLNMTAITGARAMCALGQDVPAFGFLGRWDAGRSVPVVALLLQAAVAGLLIGVASLARDGFEAMVAFTAPVFWLFMALVALTALRAAVPAGVRLAALAFAAACGWMLWSGVGYARFLASQSELAGWLGLAGLALVALGVPLAIRSSARGS
jgi:amino acid transporter